MMTLGGKWLSSSLVQLVPLFRAHLARWLTVGVWHVTLQLCCPGINLGLHTCGGLACRHFTGECATSFLGTTPIRLISGSGCWVRQADDLRAPAGARHVVARLADLFAVH